MPTVSTTAIMAPKVGVVGTQQVTFTLTLPQLDWYTLALWTWPILAYLLIGTALMVEATEVSFGQFLRKMSLREKLTMLAFWPTYLAHAFYISWSTRNAAQTDAEKLLQTHQPDNQLPDWPHGNHRP